MALPDYAMNLSNFPEMYERFLVGPLFQPWADVLLDRVSLAAGDRVLDVACGTGIVARRAKVRLGEAGQVVGVDVSPQMLTIARDVAPDIDWREGNASALPVGATEKFDVVVCQQGLQFFPDKSAASAQMRAVLAPGGDWPWPRGAMTKRSRSFEISVAWLSNTSDRSPISATASAMPRRWRPICRMRAATRSRSIRCHGRSDSPTGRCSCA